jgi:hypothetical protein
MSERMSRERFNENKQAILAAIDALMDNPKSRKRFRALALYEETTGELLAEVFRLTYGPVVVHRSSGRVSRAGKSAMFVRQGRGTDDLVVAPFSDDPDQRFNIVSAASADRGISGRDLAQWLAEGKTRHAISQPTEDDRSGTLTRALNGSESPLDTLNEAMVDAFGLLRPRVSGLPTS